MSSSVLSDLTHDAIYYIRVFSKTTHFISSMAYLFLCQLRESLDFEQTFITIKSPTVVLFLKNI